MFKFIILGLLVWLCYHLTPVGTWVDDQIYCYQERAFQERYEAIAKDVPKENKRGKW